MTAGGTLPVLGTNWPVGAAVVIRWPDGSQIAGADVQPDGRFATLVRVPQNAQPGMTYQITASGGGVTATADVAVTAVYDPTLTVPAPSIPPRAGTAVQYSGSGWPPNTDYTIRFGATQVGGGTTTTAGTIGGSFTIPQNTLRGTYTVTAAAGVYSATAQLTTQ